MSVVVRQSSTGRGVFSSAPITGGADILNYVGPLLRYEQTTPQTLALQIGPDLYIGESGHADDFVNHSCDPNAGLRINGTDVRLVAIRDIAAEEQITFDYSTTMDEDDFEFNCRCGSPICRGRIRDFKHLPAAIQQRYLHLGVVPDYNRRYGPIDTLSGAAELMQHQFPFDPTYGYNQAALLAVPGPPMPADFAEFWQRTYDRASQFDPRPTRRLIREGRRCKIYEVEFDAWDHLGDGTIRIGGWMTVPTSLPVDRGIVVGHGYGGRDGPDLSPLIASAAVIYPCARGFNRSARANIPNVADQHVLHGIESRETYIHRGCVIDLWAAAWALFELELGTSDNLTYAGASFGGGIGALALPWGPLFRRAFLDFPSFGNHPLRLTLPCIGSGEAIRRSGGTMHLPVLQYFDAATAAQLTRIPVMVAAARFDPAVPPPGQFAICNCLAGKKKLLVRTAAHYEWSGAAEEDAEVRREASAWLQA